MCENTAACSQGGDSDWIARCQNDAKILKAESNSYDCRALYDSYYACADEHYECHGATTSFPSCDAASDALAACLASAGSDSACGQLDARNAACAAAADGGEPRRGRAADRLRPQPRVSGALFPRQRSEHLCAQRRRTRCLQHLRRELPAVMKRVTPRIRETATYARPKRLP